MEAKLREDGLEAGAIVTRDEKTITGSIFGTAHAHRDFNKYGTLFLQGKLPMNCPISNTYPLTPINEASALMLTCEIGRGIILFA